MKVYEAPEFVSACVGGGRRKKKRWNEDLHVPVGMGTATTGSCDGVATEVTVFVEPLAPRRVVTVVGDGAVIDVDVKPVALLTAAAQMTLKTLVASTSSDAPPQSFSTHVEMPA